jgi:hypothetical protein
MVFRLNDLHRENAGNVRSQARYENAPIAQFRTVFVMFAAFFLFAFAPLRASDFEVWQVSPYQIQVLTSFDYDNELTTILENEFRTNLLLRIESVVGAPWNLTIDSATLEQRREYFRSLDDVTVEQAAKVAGKFDKIMFLALSAKNGQFSATVREFDVRSQQLGPSTTRVAWQLGKLRDAAADAIFAAFSPLADIESVEMKNRTTVLHLKASALPTRDPALAVIQPGMIFRPYIRLNDRDGKVRRVTPVAWTFLAVDSATTERLECRIESGMSTPLNVKRRPRMEQIALAIHPSPTPSVLSLQSRTEPKVPLPGYEVYEYDKGSKDAATPLGRTNWQGQISIAPTNKVLRFLVVKNGGELLARLPFVPGLDPFVTAEIANDDYRLQAEGFIVGLQEQLIDLFAQREMLRRGAIKRLEEGDIDVAKEFYDELSRLPTQRTFSMKLMEEKKKLDTRDPVVQGKIDKLFKETQKNVDKFLDDKIIEELAQEIHEAKQDVEKKE